MFLLSIALLTFGCQGFASVDNMRSDMPMMGTITMQQKAELRRMWQMPTLRNLSKEEAKRVTASYLAVPAGVMGEGAKTSAEKKAAKVLTSLYERGAKALGVKFEKTVNSMEALRLWHEGGALKGIHWASPGAFPYKPAHSRMVQSGHYQQFIADINATLTFQVTTSLVNDPVISTEDLRTLDAMFPVAAPEGFEKHLYGDEPGYKKDPKMYSRKRPTLDKVWQMFEEKTIGGGVVIVAPVRTPHAALVETHYQTKRFVYYKGAEAFSVLVILEKSVI